MLTDTIAVSLGSRSDITVHLGDARRGNVLQVKVTDMTGILQEVAVISDLFQHKLRRFTGATIRYTGAPTVSLLLDGTTKKSDVALTSVSVPSEALVTFPAMSEGLIPHVTGVENDTTRIFSVDYVSEDV